MLLLLVLAGCTDLDRDGWSTPADCDDLNPRIHPGADEICDGTGIDEDCDGRIDDEDDIAYTVLFVDRDGDGAGDAATAHLAESCAPAPGLVENGADCDDDDAAIHVGAQEVCDGADNNCDGRVDDDDPELDRESAQSWYVDADGDGYGNEQESIVTCSAPLGHVSSGNDCADTDPDRHPGAEEVCGDGVDQNCDGSASPCGFWGNFATNGVGRQAPGWSNFGATMAAAGDLDRDGWPDLAITAPSEVRPSGGAVLLAFGPFLDGRQVTDAPHAELSGAGQEAFGAGLAAGRDWNGDGRVDVLVGAPAAGEAGAAAGRITLFAGPFAEGSRLAQDEPVHLYGPGPGTQAGSGLAPAGDVDGDGHEDLLVAGTDDPVDPARRGAAFLVAGPLVDEVDLGWAAGRWFGERPARRLGSALAGVGDVDGDGLDDVVLGGGGGDAEDATVEGAAWLLFGPCDGSLDDAAVTLYGQPGEGFGESAAGGDLDGDGYAEWAVGAPRADGGSVRVYAGVPSDREDAEAIIRGGSTAGLRLGHTLAVLADGNADGRADLAVGAPTTPGTSAVGGRSLVYQGPVRGSLGLTDATGFAAGGMTQGSGVASAGDLDVDGRTDLLRWIPGYEARPNAWNWVYVDYAQGM